MVGNQNTRLLFDKSLDDILEKYPVLDLFKAAANSFVKQVSGTTQIWAASRDWFLESWGRDTFISLPGILLTTKRFSEAKAVIQNYAHYEKKGLIPNRIRPHNIEYNNADGSMWFIQAIKSYLNCTKDWDFVRQMRVTIKNIIDNYIQGTSYKRFGEEQKIKMDENDMLIITPPQATWMDAEPIKHIPITPRNGKAVEINALWYSNLRFLATIENHFNINGVKTKHYTSIADRVKIVYNEKFWNNHENTLYDVLDGDPHQGAIRPNMIIAVSHGGDLLPESRQISAFNSVLNDLLTPGGLRTLSPRDSNYIGEYNTNSPPEEKDLAYHQGTAWPWLMGSYCDALKRVRTYQGKNINCIKKEIGKTLTPLIRFCMESPFKSLPEVFSGNPPYFPGGTTSQAWSVSEILRVIVENNICELNNKHQEMN